MVICECSDPACRLRYPAGDHEAAIRRCPRCGAPVRQMHRLPPTAEKPARPSGGSLPSESSPMPGYAALLDNVRSLLNVGSIFRSADGAGFAHLYLGGVTPGPDNRKLAKTALGAEQSLAWSHHRNSVVLAQELLAQGRVLWALEEEPGATALFDAPPFPPQGVLVAGSETAGIDPDLLQLCARRLAIPMQGTKRSLNVATAFGIAAVLLTRPR